jgi:ATP-dependent DNA ligase
LQRASGPKPPVSLHVFDVLAIGAIDVRPVSLLRRKELVERVVARSKGELRAVPYVVGDRAANRVTDRASVRWTKSC